MIAFITLAVTAALTVVMVRAGHKSAVAKSEANLRARFDSGQASPEARKLMREAGYNV